MMEFNEVILLNARGLLKPLATDGPDWPLNNSCSQSPISFDMQERVYPMLQESFISIIAAFKSESSFYSGSHSIPLSRTLFLINSRTGKGTKSLSHLPSKAGAHSSLSCSWGKSMFMKLDMSYDWMKRFWMDRNISYENFSFE